MSDSSFSEKPAPKGKQILIVDDDYYFRLALEKSLSQSGHQATCAENVEHAQQLISLEEFDLVISDIRMPDATGIDLLNWVKSSRPIPVILMTGFSDIAETQEAAQLGAAGFLVKPFKKDEVLAVIESCFRSDADKASSKGGTDSDFCKISIDDFISGKEMKFDIFIRITENKFVKIAHSGENIAPDRIQSYKKKNISLLYMRKEDFRKYLNFNLTIANQVTQSKKIDHVKKVNFIKHASEVFLQNLYDDEMDKGDFLHAELLVQNVVSLLADNQDAADMLAAMSNHTDYLYAHCIAVSLYSTMIGKRLGWTSPATLFRLSVGGLLHDVGKKEIPKEVLAKPRKSQTPEEIALLESHPIRGAQLLSGVAGVPSDVVQIAHEHHENCQGFGYPSRLTRSKINPLARVVAVANEFCNLAIKNPNSEGMRPIDAIRQMVTLNSSYFDRDALKALTSVFGITYTDDGVLEESKKAA